jgi:RNA-binding protein
MEAPRELSGSDRRHLRRLAHALDPVVQIGAAGVTSGVIARARSRSRRPRAREGAHRARARRAPPRSPSALAGATRSALAGLVGHVAMLYRPASDPTGAGSRCHPAASGSRLTAARALWNPPRWLIPSRRTVAIVLVAAVLIVAFSRCAGCSGIELASRVDRDAVSQLGPGVRSCSSRSSRCGIPLGVPSALVLIGGGSRVRLGRGDALRRDGALDLRDRGLPGLALDVGARAIESRAPAPHALPVRPRRLAHGRLRRRAGHRLPGQRDHLVPRGRGRHEHVDAVFALASGTGSLGRAALYTYFGSRLVDAEPAEMLGRGRALRWRRFSLPLAFPAPRAWLLQAFNAPRRESCVLALARGGRR